MTNPNPKDPFVDVFEHFKSGWEQKYTCKYCGLTKLINKNAEAILRRHLTLCEEYNKEN